MLRIVLLVGAVVFALLLGEIGLRLLTSKDAFVPGSAWGWRGDDGLQTYYTLEDGLGFRPSFTTGRYDENGALVVERPAPEEEKGKKRILFIGDSVTYRRTIELALRREFGEHDFAYWNAGVAAYNTVQEVLYYKRYNYKIEPDHVILTFHHNDFDNTPLAFRCKDGRFTVITPNRPAEDINPALYENSYLYRQWFNWRMSRREETTPAMQEKTVRDSLTDLKNLLDRQGIWFTVLVLPLLVSEQERSPEAKATHERILKMLEELGIRHYDLLPGLRAALEAGVEIQQVKDDHWHPSQAAADCFAKHLVRTGFSL